MSAPTRPLLRLRQPLLRFHGVPIRFDGMGFTGLPPQTNEQYHKTCGALRQYLLARRRCR